MVLFLVELREVKIGDLFYDHFFKMTIGVLIVEVEYWIYHCLVRVIFL